MWLAIPEDHQGCLTRDARTTHTPTHTGSTQAGIAEVHVPEKVSGESASWTAQRQLKEEEKEGRGSWPRASDRRGLGGLDEIHRGQKKAIGGVRELRPFASHTISTD